MKPITLLLVEDHAVVREGLRRLLELEADFEVIGEAQDGREAVSLAKELKPDMVLMDIAMPQLNGLEATRQLRQALPGTRVLILSAHGDEPYVIGAFEAGAAGFLLKQSSSKELCQAIRMIREGGMFVSPAFFGIRGKLPTADQGPRSKPLLTPREREVLQLVAEGKANKQVAAELGISIKTVGRHREHLMAKLDIHDAAGLTRYAIQAGVIESNVRGTII